MRRRGFLVLLAVTVLVVGAAVAVSYLRAPDTVQKEVLFPELDKRLNDVERVRVEGKGRGVTIERAGGKWVVKEADGYPALVERVRQTLVGLAQLRIIEPKTTNPEYFDRLGVEDPKGEGANSLLLTLEDRSGATVATLIVGKDRRSPAPGDSPGLYVRQPDSSQSLLVEGVLDLSVDVFDWFERDLFDIRAERVRRIELHHADGEQVVLERPRRGADFELQNLPEGKEAKPLEVRRMGTLLEDVFVDNVRAADKVQFPEDALKATVVMFDGLVGEITAARVDDKRLISYRFRHDPALAVPEEDARPADEKEGATDAAKADTEAGAEGDAETATEEGAAEAGSEGDAAAETLTPEPAAESADERPDPAKEAAELNERLSAWVYEVPDYRFELLEKRMADLTAAAKPAEKKTD